jgi:hypothetical protein
MQHNSGGAEIPHVPSGAELSVTGAATPTAAIAAANGAAQQMNGAVASQLLNTSDPAIRADILKMIVQVGCVDVALWLWMSRWLIGWLKPRVDSRGKSVPG